MEQPPLHGYEQGGAVLLPGQATAADLRVVRQLQRDPAYKLVYRNDQLNQAVFVRADAAPAAGSQG